jgi:hypothetical protein
MTLIALAVGPGRAQAECADRWPDLPCDEAYARWSVLPQISALVGYGPDGRPRSLFGAELRLRHNRPWQHLTRASTVGFGVETFRLATVEPYLSIGLDELTRWCIDCSQQARMFGVAHVALGGGVQSSDPHRAEPFALARLTLGLAFARPAGEYVATSGEQGDVRDTRFKLTSQLDIVLETVIAANGEWRFAMGIAVDPLRIVQDALELAP